MYQTLFYIPERLFGWPLFGMGILFWLLAVAVLAALGWRLVRNGRRWDEECWSYTSVGTLGLVIIGVIAPKLVLPQGFPIRGYGTCLLLAIVCSFGLLYWRLERKKYFSGDLLFSLAGWTIVCGILGARLFYVVEYFWETMYAVDPVWGTFDFPGTLLNIVNIAKGGLVVYGSIIAGTLTAVLFMLYHKLPVWKTLDLIVPSLMLGMAIGRIGCYLNGCCFGAVCDAPDCRCAVTFPNRSPAHAQQVEKGLVPFLGLSFEERAEGKVFVQAVQAGSVAAKAGLKPGVEVLGIGKEVRGQQERLEVFGIPNRQAAGNCLLHCTEPPGETAVLIGRLDGRERQYRLPFERSPVLPVYPTQLYSALGDLLLCLVLLGLSGRLRRDGLVFVAFLYLYAVMRFLIELWRDDEEPFLWTGMTVAQNVSILLVLTATLLLFIILDTRQPAAAESPEKLSD